MNLARNAGNLNCHTNAIAGGRRIENHARLASRLRPHRPPCLFPGLSGQIHLGRLGCETVILTDNCLMGAPLRGKLLYQSQSASIALPLIQQRARKARSASAVITSPTLRPAVCRYSAARRPGPIRNSIQPQRFRCVPVSVRRTRSPSVTIPTRAPRAPRQASR